MKLPTSSSLDDSAGREPARHEPRPLRGRGRLRTGVTVGIAISVLIGTAAFARAAEGGRSPGTGPTHPRTGATVGAPSAGTSSWSPTPHRMPGGDLSYGTWQGHRIVLPARLAPPAGSRLTSIVVGRGVVAFYCVNGTFVETEPLINLFAVTGQPVGVHYLGPSAAVPLSWGSSVDGSRADMAVVRTMAVPATAPRVLLRAVATAGGPRTAFGGTTAIVRLPITGGVAPAAQCAVPTQRATSRLLTFYLIFKGGRSTGS